LSREAAVRSGSGAERLTWKLLSGSRPLTANKLQEKGKIMKRRILRSKPTFIETKRWAAYAAAGAASVAAGGNSAEASIHYSGFQNVAFPPHSNDIGLFSLDKTQDNLFFSHVEFSDVTDGFAIGASV